MPFWKRAPHIVTDERRIESVLDRGVAEVLPSRDGLRTLLTSGRRIRLYQGFDPTGADLHIGHMVGLRKLAQFQALGHEVIFLIGDGTGQAGDPSGKAQVRERHLTHRELLENARSYRSQAGRILRFSGPNAARVRFNGSWLNELKLADVLDIAGHFTLQQLSERDLFRERVRRGEAVSVREFLYPMLQGYDSVAMEIDLEIGATDQTFNMLAGRTLVKQMLGREKFVLTMPLLTDAHGRKIGKTEGNVIALTDEPDDLYGKIMALGDDVIAHGFEYLTDVPMDEVRAIEQAAATENPKPHKERLAREIVRQLHGENAATRAHETFERTFAKGEVPTLEAGLDMGTQETLGDVLLKHGFVKSKADFKRLVAQGAVRNLEDNIVITDEQYRPSKPETFRIGKKRFVRIEPL